MLQKGRSLHIGLNNVDQQAYEAEGWVVPQLAGCLNDAKAMQFLAADQGFITHSLTDDQAIASEVIRMVSSIGKELETGDTFVLTYSGHGGQVSDVNGDEDDSLDETWILYDRMLIDDELFQLFSQFAPGVRIFMLSDSCHSGTVARMIVQKAVIEKYRELTAVPVGVGAGAAMKGALIAGGDVVRAADTKSRRDIANVKRAASVSREVRFRGVPTAMSEALYQGRKREYDTFQYLSGRPKDATFGPSLILISGCQDNQLSQDGDKNGLFTQNLLDVWNAGFTGNYRELWNRISSNMPSYQTPNFFTLGDVSSFRDERPFTIKTQTYNPSSGLVPKMWVDGGSTSRSRSAGAPDFRVDTQGAPYYVVEFATSLELFDSENHGNERSESTFWASWEWSPLMRSEFSFYPMPNTAWNALKSANRIYFRVGTTTA
jgi:hypothetical protein